MDQELPDQLAILKLVTGRLDAAGIPYMVTGSIAGGHYGPPRMTRDIDIVIDLATDGAARLAAALGGEFGGDEAAIRSALGRRGLFNLIHREAIVKVDFVVRKDTAYRIEEFDRRHRVQVDGHPLWMVAPEDLILSKLLWAKDTSSDVQLRDVRGILAIQQRSLDRAYLARWAAALSVLRLLEEAEA